MSSKMILYLFTFWLLFPPQMRNYNLFFLFHFSDFEEYFLYCIQV
uniref:Uncharacterized protein n=1 Tax=Rhizophora mucronata TaxID=61149 RepID=A0A2P2K803_RHIMU